MQECNAFMDQPELLQPIPVQFGGFDIAIHCISDDDLFNYLQIIFTKICKKPKNNVVKITFKDVIDNGIYDSKETAREYMPEVVNVIATAFIDGMFDDETFVIDYDYKGSALRLFSIYETDLEKGYVKLELNPELNWNFLCQQISLRNFSIMHNYEVGNDEEDLY